MGHLPVIVGFGGISSAGRGSFHQGYKRMVASAIDVNAAIDAYVDLAMLMGLIECVEGQYQVDSEPVTKIQVLQRFSEVINNSTLIRKIEKSYMDVDQVEWHQAAQLNLGDHKDLQFSIATAHMPRPLPSNWQIITSDKKQTQVKVLENLQVLLPTTRDFIVKSAGQLPTGFDLSKTYASRHHPKGLQMTMYGASDAIQSMGIAWQTVMERVAPDNISVYASSAMGQLDDNGYGGMMGNRLKGKKVSSKHLALGLAEMPADFINAYLMGGLGNTGGSIGACASFLYNLKHAVNDIQSGRARVAIVGGAEAPITSEIIDGYATMGALATAEHLKQLDDSLKLDEADYQRACRPFSSNCGFTLSESAQFVILFDDALALELGANIHGAIDHVFVNADGHKKSISSPGLGNWITVAKALASARSLLGERGIQRSYMHAHGTGTPQNRVSESEILNETAKTFGIKNWPVTAIKNYVGHSLGTSSGDQLIAALGTWQYGVIPGIQSIDHIADDVKHSELDILMDHKRIQTDEIDVAFLNSKGFGGNNATAGVLAPHIVKKMLEGRHGSDKFEQYKVLNVDVMKQAEAYNQACLKGEDKTLYLFDHHVLQGSDIEYTASAIHVPGWGHGVDLNMTSEYSDMLK